MILKKEGKGRRKLCAKSFIHLQNHNPKVSCSVRRKGKVVWGVYALSIKILSFQLNAKRLKSTHSSSWQEGDYQLWLQCSSESVAVWPTQSIFIRGESVWGSRQTLWEVFSKVEAYQKRTNRNFPRGPVAKTPWSQCRGLGFSPWLGN